MSDLIDELARKDAQRNPQIAHAEQIRLRNVEVCKAKLPLFWWTLLEQVKILCAELRKAFPSYGARHCNCQELNEGFRIDSEAPPPRRAVKVTWNLAGTTLDYTETVQKELWHLEKEERRGEIRITVRSDDESLVVHYRGLSYDSPRELAEALVRYVIQE